MNKKISFWSGIDVLLLVVSYAYRPKSETLKIIPATCIILVLIISIWLIIEKLKLKKENKK